jgi:hypothetical protein
MKLGEDGGVVTASPPHFAGMILQNAACQQRSRRNPLQKRRFLRVMSFVGVLARRVHQKGGITHRPMLW